MTRDPLTRIVRPLAVLVTCALAALGPGALHAGAPATTQPARKGVPTPEVNRCLRAIQAAMKKDDTAAIKKLLADPFTIMLKGTKGEINQAMDLKEFLPLFVGQNKKLTNPFLGDQDAGHGAAYVQVAPDGTDIVRFGYLDHLMISTDTGTTITKALVPMFVDLLLAREDGGYRLKGINFSPPEFFNEVALKLLEDLEKNKTQDEKVIVARYKALVDAFIRKNLPNGWPPKEAPQPPTQAEPKEPPATQPAAPQEAVKTVRYPDGRVYEGEVADGQPHGLGTMDYTGMKGSTSLRYTGHWKNGQKHGTGAYYWKSGAKYTGDWEEGKQQGHGVYDYVSGARYDGQWLKDQKHGQGTYTWPDGAKYVGDWVDGRATGGWYYTKDGKRLRYRQDENGKWVKVE